VDGADRLACFLRQVPDLPEVATLAGVVEGLDAGSAGRGAAPDVARAEQWKAMGGHWDYSYM
jgi:hypothetical protein